MPLTLVARCHAAPLPKVADLGLGRMLKARRLPEILIMMKSDLMWTGRTVWSGIPRSTGDFLEI